MSTARTIFVVLAVAVVGFFAWTLFNKPAAVEAPAEVVAPVEAPVAEPTAPAEAAPEAAPAQ